MQSAAAVELARCKPRVSIWLARNERIIPIDVMVKLMAVAINSTFTHPERWDLFHASLR
jgi:hypothetical protein